MHEGSSDNSNPASDENCFSLTRRQIVTLVAAPLLAMAEPTTGRARRRLAG